MSNLQNMMGNSNLFGGAEGTDSEKVVILMEIVKKVLNVVIKVKEKVISKLIKKP